MSAVEKLYVAAWKLENPSEEDSSTLHMLEVAPVLKAHARKCSGS